MRDSKEYQAMAQKAKMQGMEFNYQTYQNMKRTALKERVVREDQDPEIQQAWEKMNVDKLFSEFTSRPIRSSVNDMAENYMAMAHEKRMSARDKARRDFVRNFKKQQAIKRSAKNTFIAEREKYLDF